MRRVVREAPKVVLFLMVIVVLSKPAHAQEVMGLENQIAIMTAMQNMPYVMAVMYINDSTSLFGTLVPHIQFDEGSFYSCSASGCAAAAAVAFLTGPAGPEAFFAGCTGVMVACAIQSIRFTFGENQQEKEVQTACLELSNVIPRGVDRAISPTPTSSGPGWLLALPR